MPSRNRIAADLARVTLCSILPLKSSKMAAAKGVSSAPNDEIRCSALSSKIRKSFAVKPETNFPEASVTVTFNTTTSLLTRTTSSSSWCCRVVNLSSESEGIEMENKRQKRVPTAVLRCIGFILNSGIGGPHLAQELDYFEKLIRSF